MYTALFLLLADAQGAAPPAPGGDPNAGGNWFTGMGFMPVIVIGMVLFFWLFILSPMRKQEKERAALLTSLKKGDEIVTHSGIYGEIVSVSDTKDEITVKVADNVRLKMIKGSILRNITNEDAAKAAKDAGKIGAAPAAAPTAVTTKEGDK